MFILIHRQKYTHRWQHLSTVKRFCHESGDCQVDIGHQTSDKFKQTWHMAQSIFRPSYPKIFPVFFLLKSKVHFYRFILYVSVFSSSKNPLPITFSLFLLVLGSLFQVHPSVSINEQSCSLSATSHLLKSSQF